jgi:quinol monooxygenase YgiN
MIVLRFRGQVQAARIDEALDAFRAVVGPSRALDGVLSFDVARDLLDPNVVVATEVFEDADARARQEALPEVGRVMSLLPEVLAAPPEATQFEVSSSASAL